MGTATEFHAARHRRLPSGGRIAGLITECGLRTEGTDGSVIVRVNVKNVEQANELQCLQNELAGIYKLDGSAMLFGGSLGTDKGADPAGIHTVDFAEIDDDLWTAIAQHLIELAAESFDCRA